MTLDLLAGLGCNSVQGYYLGRPQPAADLVRWLAESTWKLEPGDEHTSDRPNRRESAA